MISASGAVGERRGLRGDEPMVYARPRRRERHGEAV